MVRVRALRLATFAVCLALWSTAGRALEITSPDVADGAALRLTQVHSQCGGENRSPALSWSGVPNGTQSYAATMFDTDANGGSGFWHWAIFDIPASAHSLSAGIAPAAILPNGAVQAENDFGMAGYGGACPPPGSGTHHYRLTIYAMAAAHLPLGNTVSASAVATWLKSHALATATLTGTYGR